MLFETNELFNTLNTFGIDMNSLIGVQNLKSRDLEFGNSKFVSAQEGFQKGNLYKMEYRPYKNMNYLPLRPKNEKEMKKLKVYEYSFALTDLGFHLDLHPEDKESFELFKRYTLELKKATDEYERIYGPLCLKATTGEVFDWVDNPWPWDHDKGDMYV